MELLRRFPRPHRSAAWLGLPAALLGGLFLAQPAAAILNGAAAADGSWPWAAHLTITASAGAEVCTASVVAPSVILTAGHCVVDAGTNAPVSAAGLTVLTGRTDRANVATGQLLGVAQLAIYPGFVLGDDRGDVALLQLASPTTAPPLPLAQAGDSGWANAAGAPLRAAGWGRTDPAVLAHPNVLNEVTLAAQSDASCTSALASVQPMAYDPATMFCAGSSSSTAGVCSGDSGGPAIQVSPAGVTTQVGVISWNRDGCVHPDVFARVSKLSSWLGPEIALLQATAPAAPAAVVPVTPAPAPVAPVAPVKPSPPTLRTGRSSGAAGGYARLRFWTHNHARRVRVHAQVYDGTHLVYSRTTAYFVPRPGMHLVSWRVPKRQKGPLWFCMSARSAAGLVSSKACSPLTIRALRGA